MKRIKNIDFLKFIALFVVIFAHFKFDVLLNSDNLLYRAIYFAFHNLAGVSVLILFMVSGYLVINKKYEYPDIIKKCIVLFLLAVFYKLLCIFVMADNWDYRIFMSTIFSQNYTAEVHGDYRVNYLWYLYAYIGILLVQPLLYKMFFDKKNYTYFTLIVVISCFVLAFLNTELNIFSFVESGFANRMFVFGNSNSHAISMFLVGGLVKLYEKEIEEKISKNKIKISFWTIITFVLSLLFATIYANFIITDLDRSINPTVYHFSTIFGLLMAVAVFVFFRYMFINIDNKFVNFVSKNSLGVYLLHWPITYLIKKEVFAIPIFQNMLSDFIFSIVSLLVTALVVYILSKNKYTRKLVNV